MFINFMDYWLHQLAVLCNKKSQKFVTFDFLTFLVSVWPAGIWPAQFINKEIIKSENLLFVVQLMQANEQQIEIFIFFFFFKIPTRSNLDHITDEIAKKAGRCLNQNKCISLVFLLKIPNAYNFCKEVNSDQILGWSGAGLNHGKVKQNFGCRKLIWTLFCNTH